MLFILYKPNINTFSPEMVAKVDGVCLQYKISQFFGVTGGWSYGLTVKKEIQDYLNKGKKVIVSVQWGNACGNAIWNNYHYIELYEKRKEGSDPTLPKYYDKFPVPYETAYLNKVFSFLEYLSNVLGGIKNDIILKVGGINEKTFELRVPNQDFKETDDPKIAYVTGGIEWLEKEYTTEKMREAMQRLLNDHDRYFPDTLKIVAPIAGSNGFPKINDEGEIDTTSPPLLLDDLIAYMKWFPNYAIMPTALYATGGTPKNMCNSGLPVWFQLNNDRLNKTSSVYDFEHAILNGKDHNAVGIEVYEINVREHPEIIEKYH